MTKWITVFHNFVNTPLFAELLLAVLGILVTVTGIYAEVVSKKRNLFQEESNRKSLRDRYSGVVNRIGFIRRAEEDLDKKLSVLRVNYTARDITDIRMITVVVSVIISAVLRNGVLFFPLAIMSWQLPGWFVEGRIQKRLELFETQFLEAMKEFLTEFSTLGNSQQALVKMAPKIQYPLRYEFEFIARRLNSGEPPKNVFDDFAERTQNQWTRLFSHLMIFHFEQGARVESQILQLMDKLSTDQILRDKNRTEIAAIRKVNSVLNFLVPLVYLADRVINPTAASVYVTTTTGRVILAVVAFVCLISLNLGKRLTDY